MYRQNRAKVACFVSIILKQIIHFGILCYISYVFLFPKLLLLRSVSDGKLSSHGANSPFLYRDRNAHGMAVGMAQNKQPRSILD